MYDKLDVIYTRQSRYKEVSISHETQKDACLNYLRARGKDISKVVIIHEDKNMSGGTLDRPQLKRLRKLIKQGRVASITVYKLDRMSRSLVQFSELLKEFEENGVTFTTTDMEFDTSSAMGRLNVNIVMLFAQFERENTIERVSDAYVNRSEKGFFMGGRRPYGLDFKEYYIDGKKTKTYVHRESEMVQIEELYNTYSIDGFSLRTVQKHMIEAGMVDYSGSNWSTAKISAILRNPLYVKADENIYEYFKKRNTKFASDLKIDAFTGEYCLKLYGWTKHRQRVNNGEIKADDFSDLTVVMLPTKGRIDSDLWLKCVAKLEKNEQIGNSLNNKNSWLAGKVFCNQCGHRFTTTKSKPTKDGEVTIYFNCIGHLDKKICNGPSKTIYADELEFVVEKLITQKLKALKTNKHTLSDKNKAIVDKLYREIDEIKDKIRKFTDMLLEEEMSNYTLKALNERIAELEDTKTALIREVDNIIAKDKIVGKTIDLSEKWRKSSFKTKKLVTDTLINSIIIHKDGSFEVVWKV